MAYRAIRQTHAIQKNEKRERLLNEIIEWAVGVTECGFEKDFAHAELSDLLLDFAGIREGRSHYVSQIALTFGQDLQRAVEKLVKDLNDHLDLLIECIDNISRATDKAAANSAAIKRVGKHRALLNNSANKVIEEVTKIKTRDIG